MRVAAEARANAQQLQQVSEQKELVERESRDRWFEDRGSDYRC